MHEHCACKYLELYLIQSTLVLCRWLVLLHYLCAPPPLHAAQPQSLVDLIRLKRRNGVIVCPLHNNAYTMAQSWAVRSLPNQLSSGSSCPASFPDRAPIWLPLWTIIFEAKDAFELKNEVVYFCCRPAAAAALYVVSKSHRIFRHMFWTMMETVHIVGKVCFIVMVLL